VPPRYTVPAMNTTTESSHPDHPEIPLPVEDPAKSGERWEVSVPHFQGPLDLLLHLVRSQNMDILDIPVFQISRQYNEYLDAMQPMDLEIVSEYLLMAATLTHIKSRLMLPTDPEAADAGEDPRAELSRQLLEYEKYKNAAEELAAMESARELVYVRTAPPPEELAGCYTLRVDLTDLVRAFERVLRRLESEDRTTLIRRDDFKIQDLMRRIVNHFDRGDGVRTVSFRELLDACRTRLERVVLFLALLELVKLGAVDARQPTPRDDIAILGRDLERAETIDDDAAEEQQGQDSDSSENGTGQGSPPQVDSAQGAELPLSGTEEAQV